MGAAKKLLCSKLLYSMTLSVILLNGLLLANIEVAILQMVPPTYPNLTDNNNILSFTTTQQGNILGIAYLGSALSRIIGGRLAEVVGTRRVIGFAILIAALITFSTPLVSYLGYYFLLINRILIGVFTGIFPPAIMPLCSKWFSPKHNGMFAVNFLALVLSVVLSFALNGNIVTFLGWPSVFYINGAICLIIMTLWFSLVFDSPELHPWISADERDYVLKETAGNAHCKEKVKFSEIPWWSMVKSRPVWAIVVCHMAYNGTAHVMGCMIPRFFTQYFGVGIKTASFYAGIPGIGHFCLGILVSTVLEKYLRKFLIHETTTRRKLFEAMAMLIPAVFMLCEIFFGTSLYTVLAFYTAALSANGAVVAGHIPSCLDISPNFSGTIFGIANTFSSLNVYGLICLSMYLVGDGQSLESWQYLFWIFFVEYVVSGLVFVAFSSGDVQRWNEVTAM